MAKKTQTTQLKKVVLAYSGGLDTSVIVPWLKENYGCEVICYTADVGQGEELSGLPEKAKASGASKIYIEDLREEFAGQYLFTLIKSGAIYERNYLLGTSIARPLIAKHMVEVAHLEGADAVAHGCTGKGNDQVRFELTAMALDPRLKVIAPWREWDITSREDALAYAAAHNVPVTATLKSIYSRDRNLWHISHEGGILEDPWAEPEEDMFKLTVSPEKAPDEPEYVEIAVRGGRAGQASTARPSPRPTWCEALNELGGKHGIGRVDLVENRLVGMKSRGVYETPGGTILMEAHKRARADHPGPRHAALQGRGRPALRRAGLLRAVVHPAARGPGRLLRRDPEARHRHGAPQAVQGQPDRRRAQVSPTACTARTSPPLAQDSGLRPERRGRASSPCSACRSKWPPCATSSPATKVEYDSPDYSHVQTGLTILPRMTRIFTNSEYNFNFLNLQILKIRAIREIRGKLLQR